jgi:very-short-patch-repair endonuclease
LTDWTANPPLRLECGVRHPDVLIEDVMLIVEVDGHRYHSSPKQVAADGRRQNAFVELGYTVLRFTPAEIADDPERVVALVRRTIDRLRRDRTCE